MIHYKLSVIIHWDLCGVALNLRTDTVKFYIIYKIPKCNFYPESNQPTPILCSKVPVNELAISIAILQCYAERVNVLFASGVLAAHGGYKHCDVRSAVI